MHSCESSMFECKAKCISRTGLAVVVEYLLMDCHGTLSDLLQYRYVLFFSAS